MCQEKVICFLKENKGWWSVKELSKGLGVSVQSVSRPCRTLRRKGLIWHGCVTNVRYSPYTKFVYRFKGVVR